MAATSRRRLRSLAATAGADVTAVTRRTGLLARVRGRAWVAQGLAELVARATRTGLERRTPGGRARWTRTNHAGDEVSLLEGPAVAAGVVAGVLTGDRPGRHVVAGSLALVAAVGAYDDLAGNGSSKGLRGHWRSLRAGRVTTGAVKVGVIGCAGTASAAALRRDAGRPVRHPGTLLDGALVAASANLVNLLDLRPGRALKVSGAAVSPALVSAAARPYAGAVLGAVHGVADNDLSGRDMLGDCGANVLGAAVGCAVVAAAPAPLRLLGLGGLVGLTLLSERVSFTEVIARTPWLRALDEMGRDRPPGRHQ